MGIDTAADPGIVESFQILVEEIDIVVHLFGRDDKAEVFVGGFYFYRFDITWVVLVEKGLKRRGEIVYRKFSDDGAVEFIAHDCDRLIAIDNAGFDGERIKGNALSVFKYRSVINAGASQKVIDIAACKIESKFAVEPDLLIFDHAQLGQIGLVHGCIKVEFGLILAEVDKAIQARDEIGVGRYEVAVEFFMRDSPIYLYVGIGITREFEVLDISVELGIHRCGFETDPMDLALEGDLSQLVIVEELPKVKMIQDDITRIKRGIVFFDLHIDIGGQVAQVGLEMAIALKTMDRALKITLEPEEFDAIDPGLVDMSQDRKQRDHVSIGGLEII